MNIQLSITAVWDIDPLLMHPLGVRSIKDLLTICPLPGSQSFYPYPKDKSINHQSSINQPSVKVMEVALCVVIPSESTPLAGVVVASHIHPTLRDGMPER